MSTDDNIPDEEIVFDEEVVERPALHEDAVRFIRQRLLALEEGRDKDAATIADYLESEFGLVHGRDLVDVSLADVDEQTLQRWHDYYALNAATLDAPKKAQKVTVLVGYAAEPVFRIPASLDGRGPGRFETPLHLEYPMRPAWATGLDQDPWDNEYEHLRPRSKDGRTGKPKALPEAVEKAIRPWTPQEETA